MGDETVPRRFDVRLHRLFFFNFIIIIVIILIHSGWIQMEVNSFQQFKLTCGPQERPSDQY